MDEFAKKDPVDGKVVKRRQELNPLAMESVVLLARRKEYLGQGKM